MGRCPKPRRDGALVQGRFSSIVRLSVGKCKHKSQRLVIYFFMSHLQRKENAMLLRIIGSLAVIVGCAGLGLYYSSKEGFRINELLEFKKALLILSSEIEYMRAPLGIACANIAKRATLTAQTLFSRFAELLALGEGETAYQLWATSLDGIKEKSFIAPEDYNVLDGFGKTLGYLDKQMQQNAINFAVNYIDEKVAALQNASGKSKRMYRSLGIICGLLITVVLW